MSTLRHLHIHREGHRPLLLIAVITGLLCIGIQILFSPPPVIIFVACLIALIAVSAFFRVPTQLAPACNPTTVIAPASGTIVNIEEIYDDEYFKDQRLRVSIFLSIFNVHLNTVPVDGQVVYMQYHPGEYLLAFHPKASELNERNTIAIQVAQETAIGIRQIAGVVVRRISTYVQPNQIVECGQELGFIRFGSRVDLLLPPHSLLRVHIGQRVRVGATVIAELVPEITHQPSSDVE